MTESAVSDPETSESARRLDDAIAVRAYQIWENEGCPEGTGLANWLRAEEEILFGKVPLSEPSEPEAVGSQPPSTAA
jgi:hypothetical protein